ncbi:MULTISPECIES: glycosyltransferase family 39 protein [unclassified Kitasatospora]|uniref:ArnT family glycosyltransferase n=1 Tax=unclassified Kitasatospora TaxID=2633591 RepID=UPI00070DAE74|nr:MULTISPECIES: glycosyltransferase family 39 protein [unclassified Kitasatospora]KQV21684.1 glycosyl transferase [Kitasatospora sp. Root107]KRB75525.1 glycosyl transferase [Kitasatospora sp. Root187]
MTTTSSPPPTSEPWPEAANYPPPETPEPPARATVEPLFPPVELLAAVPKGPTSWAGRLRTLPTRAWRGRPDDPAWARPALLGLLAATALLYFWNLSSSGWANSFYSAAVQAGSQSWKAFFYGSSDAANFITVDKAPMSLWPMALSVRIFGLNSFALLAPQVLMGVVTVATVYATVRRRFSPLGGLVAGAVLALTPVAALMFRFNNPDALLVLLLTLAAYGLVRATETASARWMLFVGMMLGFGFLTKTLQAFLVLPAFALVYLLVAPTGLGRRVLQLLYGAGAMIASAGWWVAIVELTPASARPYIGGSQDNSFLSVTFGYNGFGRLTGEETGSVGGGGGRGGQGGGWGETGITRLFDGDIGGQIAWLLPAALLLLLVGLWATRRAPRTDGARTAFLVWGGWLLCTALTFSYMSGIFHQYYTVALAPAVAALVGMGVDGLWRARRRLPYAALLGLAVGGTAVWGYVLLGRSTDFVPWLRWAVLIGGLLAAVALLAGTRLPARVAGRIGAAAGVVALAAALGGPAAYAVDTVSTAHTGSIPTAGPRVEGAMGGPGGMRLPGGAEDGRMMLIPGGGQLPPGARAVPGGAFPQGGGQGGAQPGGQLPAGGIRETGGRGGMGGGAGGGGMGGLINGAQVSDELAKLLKQDADQYTWIAAAVGSQNQASYQLATGAPVMALGGFNGSDPSLTLDAFKQYVQQGKVHYFIGGAGGMGGAEGGMGGGSMGGSSQSSEISAWVAATFTAQTVGGTTVYDLTTG